MKFTLREMMEQNIHDVIVRNGGGSLYNMRWEPVLTKIVDAQRLSKKEARLLNAESVLGYTWELTDDTEFLAFYDLVMRRAMVCM
jgi:hypothetical protein